VDDVVEALVEFELETWPADVLLSVEEFDILKLI
jgi:hypothetical protein